MSRPWLLLLMLPVAAGAPAAEPAVFLEALNTGPRLFQRAVEYRGDLAALFPEGRPRALRVVETDGTGRPLRDGVGQVDVEGGEAVLALLLDGITAQGQKRFFLVAASQESRPHQTDLRLEETAEEFLISNQYFTAHVAKKGRGGFPDTIVLNGSGNRYESFFYGDRVYAKEKGSLHLRDDPSSTARIAGAGPLRIVVETNGRYGPPGR